jgi:hypothetical protein
MAPAGRRGSGGCRVKARICSNHPSAETEPMGTEAELAGIMEPWNGGMMRVESCERLTRPGIPLSPHSSIPVFRGSIAQISRYSYAFTGKRCQAGGAGLYEQSQFALPDTWLVRVAHPTNGTATPNKANLGPGPWIAERGVRIEEGYSCAKQSQFARRGRWSCGFRITERGLKGTELVGKRAKQSQFSPEVSSLKCEVSSGADPAAQDKPSCRTKPICPGGKLVCTAHPARPADSVEQSQFGAGTLDCGARSAH